MPTLPSGSANVGEAPISFRDIWHNIHGKEGDEIPILSLQPVTNLQDLSISMASASLVLEDREGIHGARYAINELWGSNYPSSIISNVLVKRGSSVESEFVDGETATITFDTTAITDHTVTLRNSLGAILDTNTVSISVGGGTSAGPAKGGTTDFASLALAEAAGYSARITKDTFNNVYSPTFEHFDTITGTDIIRSPNTLQTITNDTEETDIAMSYSVSTGTADGQSWIFSNAPTGDNSIRTPVTSTSNTTVTYTGTGIFPVNLTVSGNPSSARNSDDATQENVYIRYNQQLVSLSSNDYTINAGGQVTLSVTSKGFDGNLYFGYDTSATTSDKDFVGDDVAVDVDTRYEAEQKTRVVTLSSADTYHIKAFHAGDSVATVGATSIVVAPTFDYDTSGNQTINVNTNSAAFTATLNSGQNETITLTNNFNSATTGTYGTGITVDFTNSTANGEYTVSYDGDAEYSQPLNKTATLYVNPTVSLITSSATGYTTVDTAGNALSVATHGVAPTTYTITPTVVGSTIVQYLWAPQTGWVFNTNYDVATAGLIVGKITDGGPGNMQLSVYQQAEESGTSGTRDITITPIEPTKAFDTQPIIATTVTRLRRYTSYTINFQCDYIKNVKLQRKNISNNAYLDLVTSTATGIGNDFVDENVGPSFTIPGAANLSTNERLMRLVDVNYTSLESLDIENSSGAEGFTIYDRLAGVPTSVTPHDGNESIRVTWNDGVSNSDGNKIYVFSDAAGTTQVGSTATYTNSANSYIHSHSLTGTSRVAEYFKVSGINASGEEGVLSGVTSAAYIHPIISFTASVDRSINVDTTTTFNFTAFGGYNFQGSIICSTTSIGNHTGITNTNNQTFTPLIANGTHTITFDAVANISQDIAAVTRTLTVNPTVTMGVSPASGYTTVDTNGNALSTSSHGVAPTTFVFGTGSGNTSAPTVVGATIGAYLWTTIAGGFEFDFPYTSASTTSVTGTFTDGGDNNVTLSVYETAPTGGTSGLVTVTPAVTEPTKAFDTQPIIATTVTRLRRYSSYVINFQCDYIKNVKLQRKNSSNYWYDLVGTTLNSIATGIGNDFVDENVGPSFTIPSNASLDTTGRVIQLVDTNYTSLDSLDIKNNSGTETFTIYDRVAGIPTSVTPVDGNELVKVTWNDGESNSSGNKVYIFSDAGSTEINGSPFTYTAGANSYIHSHSLTGTSRVAEYFKVSGINASSEEGTKSALVGPAYVHPAINIGYHTSGDTVSVESGASKNFYFTALHGYNFSGTITSVPDIGSESSITATTTAANMAYGTANNVYSIRFNASANIDQTATQETETLTVNPIANFTISPTSVEINPPAGSGLSANAITFTNTSTGNVLTTKTYKIYKYNDGSDPFKEYDVSASGNKTVPGTGTDSTTAWGTGNYSMTYYVAGNSTSNTKTVGIWGNSNANAFTISNYAAQTLLLSGDFAEYPDSTLRRGSTYTVTGAIGSTPITKVRLEYEFRDDRSTPTWGQSLTEVADDIFGSNESGGTFTYDFTLPTTLPLTLSGGINAAFRARISDDNDASPISYGGAMTILDGLPVVPTIGTATVPSPSNGTANAVWTAGNFSTSFKVRLFKEDGTDLSESYTDSASPYTYSIGTALKVRKFTVSSFNIGGEESAQSSLSNAVTIYPDLTTSRNVLNPTTGIIYSTSNYQANSFTYNSPSSATSGDSKSYSYTEILDTAGVTLSNESTSTATINAGSGVGAVATRLTVSNAGGDSSYTEGGVTVNYYPKFTQSNGNPGLIITTGTTDIDPASSIGAHIYWQGFAMAGNVNDRWRFYYTDSSGGNASSSNTAVYPTSPGLGGTQSQAGQDLGIIAITGPSNGGNYRLYVERANDTSISKYTTFSVITTHSGWIYWSHNYSLQPSAYETAYDAAKDLADVNYRDTVWWSSATGASGYPKDGYELWDSQSAIGGVVSGRYNPYDYQGVDVGWYKSGFNVILIEHEENGNQIGEVITEISEVPDEFDPLTFVSKTDSQIVVKVEGDFRVTGNFDLEYKVSGGSWTNGPQDSVSSRVLAGSQNLTITSLDDDTQYYIRVRGQHTLSNGPYTTDSFNVTTDTTDDPIVISSDTTSGTQSLGAGQNKYSDIFTLTMSDTPTGGSIIITTTASSNNTLANLSRQGTKNNTSTDTVYNTTTNTANSGVTEVAVSTSGGSTTYDSGDTGWNNASTSYFRVRLRIRARTNIGEFSDESSTWTTRVTVKDSSGSNTSVVNQLVHTVTFRIRGLL